jgi:hypothetical protein
MMVYEEEYIQLFNKWRYILNHKRIHCFVNHLIFSTELFILTQFHMFLYSFTNEYLVIIHDKSQSLSCQYVKDLYTFSTL